MLCEKCKKNEATVFYEENINGAYRSYSLCTECASEMNKKGDSSDIFSLPYFGGLHDQLFGGLFGSTPTAQKQLKACPLCNSTLDDFRKNGKTGCPECYRTFRDELSGTVRSIHGSVKHIGRVPEKLRQDKEKKNEIEALKKQLSDAVAEQNFELALTLRDKIKALESEN